VELWDQILLLDYAGSRRTGCRSGAAGRERAEMLRGLQMLETLYANKTIHVGAYQRIEWEWAAGQPFQDYEENCKAEVGT
jgi:hypothetical protein